MSEELAAATTEILDFVVPILLKQGSDVNVRVLLRNVGTEPGHLEYVIDGNPMDPGRYMTVEVGTTYPTQVAPGGSIWLDVYVRYYKMPSWDLTLIARNYEGTSKIGRIIPSLSTIAEVIQIAGPVVTGIALFAYGLS